MATCLVGLGSNVGDRQRNIQRATDALAAIGPLLARSTLHSTRPIGGPAQQTKFLNAAALLQTDRSPQEILHTLHQVEHQLGRQRKVRWGPRTIDLDLLLYAQVVVNSPTLVIPHPRFAFRRFVLAPAAEIAGHMQHPTTRFTVQELLARLDCKPIHVSILGSDAIRTAAAAALHIHSALLIRPPDSVLHQQSSPAEVFTFLRQVQESWNAAASESRDSVLSNFWVGEIWTTATDSWSFAEKQELQSVWSALPNPLVAPHLVVSLQSGLGGPLLTGKLLELLDRPRQFPVFKLQESSPETVLAEISAAVKAMSK